MQDSLRRAAEILEQVDAMEAPAKQEVRGGLAPWQIRKVIAYIDAHLGRPIRNEDLAAIDLLAAAGALTLLRARRDKQVDERRARAAAGVFPLTGSEKTQGYSWGWAEWFFGTRAPMPDASGKLNFARNVLPPAAERGYGPNQFILGEQFFRYIVANDPSFDARSFRLDRDAPELERRMGDLLNADDTDLARFVRAGGKLLIWHGWSDPAIPAEMAIDLYERVRRDTIPQVGDAPVDASVRLFMVPGVQHCGGGSGLTSFDALGALEQWVEQDRVPERIEATQLVDDKVVRTRPLCAYPKQARYRSGDPDQAASFDCK